jgi:hypothetical protein
MIRGGSRSGRIACLLIGASAALAAAVPTAASAQPAVDEYTLDIPGGGGGGDSTDPGASTGGNGGVASASGGGAGGAESSAPSAEHGAESAQGGAEGTASGGGGHAARGEEIDSSRDGSGSTGAAGSLDTSSRSAPEVVADTLFDSAMLPILAALVLITGVGVWRMLRHRRTLSGQAG